jgi:hydroxymethylglutaryl-CoA lyase
LSVSAVKIVECPRDVWQGLPKPMPAEIKADYLRTLIAAGFLYLDAVSFVSRSALPQMSDAELVLEYLDPPDDVAILATVTDTKGAERAIKSGSVQTIVFPYSISPGFLERNQAQTPEEALDALEEVGTLAYKAGLDLSARIAMAFGNPFGDAWSIDEVVDGIDLLADTGVTQITLVDDLGRATAKQIADLFADVTAVHDELEVGLHLRTRPEDASAKVLAAYGAGCRRFESAIAGAGNSPFGDDPTVHNLATETLLAELRELGAELAPLRPLDGLIAASHEIVRKYGARVQ